MKLKILSYNLLGATQRPMNGDQINYTNSSVAEEDLEKWMTDGWLIKSTSTSSYGHETAFKVILTVILESPNL